MTDKKIWVGESFLLGKCDCGCGEDIQFAKHSYLVRYKNGHNTRGKITKRFRGTGVKGNYRWLYMPWHPNANYRGRIDVHVWKMTRKIGRPLYKGEVVHHIDFNSFNNDIDNLQLLPNQSEHLKIHRAQVGSKINGAQIDTSGRICVDCYSPTTEMNGESECWYSDKEGGWLCKLCYRKRKRRIAKWSKNKNKKEVLQKNGSLTPWN